MCFYLVFVLKIVFFVGLIVLAAIFFELSKGTILSLPGDEELSVEPKKGMEILFGDNWRTMRFNCGSCGQYEMIRTICLSCSLKEEMVFY